MNGGVCEHEQLDVDATNGAAEATVFHGPNGARDTRDGVAARLMAHRARTFLTEDAQAHRVGALVRNRSGVSRAHSAGREVL